MKLELKKSVAANLWKINWLRIVFLGVFLVTLPQLAACSNQNKLEASETSQQHSKMQVDIDEVQLFTHIRLPPSYQDLTVYQETGIDRMMALRFTMAKTDLEQFLASAGFRGKIQSSEPDRVLYSNFFPDLPWWEPNKAKKYLAGQIQSDALASKILVDLTNDQTVIVYLQVFTL